jgi:hypothetical protein
MKKLLRHNSLSLVLTLWLFLLWALQSWAGFVAAQKERRDQGDFLTSAGFWFQCMQNWQSEFLAVLAIVTLPIFLRPHGSPESWKVWAPHLKTGKE